MKAIVVCLAIAASIAILTAARRLQRVAQGGVLAALRLFRSSGKLPTKVAS